jgi:hypothetical protein
VAEFHFLEVTALAVKEAVLDVVTSSMALLAFLMVRELFKVAPSLHCGLCSRRVVRCCSVKNLMIFSSLTR